MAAWTRRDFHQGAVTTSYLEAGDGEPLVLLHGGEFGGSAELAWEKVIEPLAAQYRVIAPDILGFGQSSKVVDFVDGRSFRLRVLGDLCVELGIERAHFVGNSMGGAMLLADAAADTPILPMLSLVSICGGGEVANNQYMAALTDYDASREGMRRLISAMFHDPSYAADEAYVERRLASANLPGAWEAVASARFRRPGHRSSGPGDLAYPQISVPTLLIECAQDKLKPQGWAARLAEEISGASSVVVADSGHCPQIEQTAHFLQVIREFLEAKDA